MSGTKKGELAIRDKAIFHQQRRLKQATQFTHKDSADLLPLDGLKRLGTSKDLQPHSIVQRRLLEGNMTRLRGEAGDLNSRVRSPLADNKEGGDAEERSESTADDSTEERESPEESERSLRSDEEDDSSEARGKSGPDEARQTAGADQTDEGTEERQGMERSGSLSTLTALLVQCKCCETEVSASINTGSKHNLISSSCCQRLGMVPTQEGPPCGQTEGRGLLSTVKGLQLQLGRQVIQCSAYVTEDEVFELCLGLQTLLELKCCVDLSRRVLKLQVSGEELPFLEPPSESQLHHDTNENL
ncbi:nuclear receptor-interacting protein 2 isoform X2 [Hypomesus transpacificus]|uniref:nuclear receptor-interacting protein 2 isoform X2 n=1 Tax=Hypomesus transpacificus TaxID=137520 RepID=UPI001F078A87|nr:nuclear receptor-interacting protein 2 isoform X2 [Hypomesus transpacificus]